MRQTLTATCLLKGLAACASGEAPEHPVPQRLGVTSLALAGVDAGVDAGASDAGGPAAGGEGSVDGGEPAPVVPPSNGCCSTSSSGGCNDEAVAACVCAGDPFCCSEEYDALCVKQAVSRCGQDCDERPPVSDCCSASGVPGCTVPDVQACICDIDPFCCVFRFDQNCVSLGVARCDAACGAEEAP